MRWLEIVGKQKTMTEIFKNLAAEITTLPDLPLQGLHVRNTAWLQKNEITTNISGISI